MQTRSGEYVSAQIGKMGVIDATAGDFSLESGQVFNIKNDGDEAITLSVRLAGMAEGDFVETSFEVGWNPEIVRTVKADASLSSANLKYGY